MILKWNVLSETKIINCYKQERKPPVSWNLFGKVFLGQRSPITKRSIIDSQQ